MSIFRKITEAGVVFADSKSEKRNIVLTNYISLTVAAVPIVILIARLFFFEWYLQGAMRLIIGSFFLTSPIIFNRLGFINISRICLCWLPYFYLFAGTILSAIFDSSPSPSDFLTIRFFFLGFSCFPFLVFNLRTPRLFLLGLCGPVFSLVLFDPVLNFFDAGFVQQGYVDPSYSFNTVRIFISFVVIGSGCFLLKYAVEKNEQVNEELLRELEEKNRQLQARAEDEVHQLNEQLYANLQDLSEREFILNHSQRIAKIGSWEYRLEHGAIFWSDEMYNIFGLDKNFPLNLDNLYKILWGEEEGRVMINATNNLLQTGEPYDLTLRTRTPIGYTKWVRVYGFPIMPNDKIIGVRGVCHDVTYYKEAEELLRSEEEKFSKAFQGNPDLITIMRESNQMIVDANERVLDIMGYRREEILGKHAGTLNFFTSNDDRSKYYEKYFERGRVIFECPWRRKDGRIIHVVISSVRIQIQDQFYIMSVVKDVTEKKAAEERFQKAFDLSPDLMLIIRESDLIFVEANRKLEEVSGYTYEEVIGYNSIEKGVDLWVNADEKKVYFEKYYESGNVFMEVEFRKKSGETFYASVSAQRIALDDQNHMMVIVRDISERRKNQEQLLLSQANLRATINNTEVLIWSVDRDFNVITFNNPFARHIKTQYDLDVKTGERIFGTDSPQAFEMRAKWSQLYMRALAGEIIVFEETRFGIDFQYSLSPIIERDQIIGVSVFADNVTERKGHDRALAEANKKVGELKLMALRSAMSPHFIFNVLNSIQFFIAKNDRRNAINYLSTFSKLIRSILTHSVDNRIKLIDEIELLKNYVELELTRFDQKFSFVLDVDSDLDVDSIEIPSLLIQPYVENAILHGLYSKETAGTLRISIHQQDSAVVFEIEDDGIGREAATRLKTNNFPTRTSMGIKLTEERLRLINEHHRATCEIEDLISDNGPAGTRVRILLSV